jgi:hypothetical protein
MWVHVTGAGARQTALGVHVAGWGRRSVVHMGVLGEMFPGPKITDESGEDGDGQRPWRIDVSDLSRGVVLHRLPPPAEDDAPDGP